MPNILLKSKEEVFTNDLSEQIHLYAPDFVVSQDCEDSKLFDVVIIDEDIKKAEEIHEKQLKAPILLLSSAEFKIEEINFIHDIIKKPIKLSTFLERLKSCINIYENSHSGYLHFGHYTLKPIKKEIFNKKTEETVKLTEKEVAIIKYLYKSQDKIVGKNELLEHVWGYNPDVTTHTIETHIYRLRQKVEHDNVDEQLIITTEGGYRLNF